MARCFETIHLNKTSAAKLTCLFLRKWPHYTWPWPGFPALSSWIMSHPISSCFGKWTVPYAYVLENGLFHMHMCWKMDHIISIYDIICPIQKIDLPISSSIKTIYTGQLCENIELGNCGIFIMLINCMENYILGNCVTF